MNDAIPDPMQTKCGHLERIIEQRDWPFELGTNFFMPKDEAPFFGQSWIVRLTRSKNGGRPSLAQKDMTHTTISHCPFCGEPLPVHPEVTAYLKRKQAQEAK